MEGDVRAAWVGASWDRASWVRGGRYSFLTKVAAALVLVGIGDRLFWAHDLGCNVGLFGLAWVVGALVCNPMARRDRRAWLLLALATALAVAQVERSTVLGWCLFWCALTAAVLIPRAGPVGDVWGWMRRLGFNAARAMLNPMLDAPLLGKLLKRRQIRPRRFAAVLVAPVLGGLVFLGLFAAANPVIANLFEAMRAPAVERGLGFRVVLALLVMVTVWGGLRPQARRHRIRPKQQKVVPVEAAKPHVLLAPNAVTLSLVVFNAVFALQNGLDLAFLWTGARLPDAFTLAEYAHRGAFPLMVAAVLAGVFVLVALSPRAEPSARTRNRVLVLVWIAQTLFLVASSMHRMQIYVDSYSLTRLRIMVVVSMGLVGVGLVLILWRMFRGKSAAWLLNANAATLGLALLTGVLVDPGALAADWNVAHAREVGGAGVNLDVCYLADLGPSALVAMTRFEEGSAPALLRERMRWQRRDTILTLQSRLNQWQAWTWRDARRLSSALRLDPVITPPGTDPRKDRYCGLSYGV
jgi:hypothetical protein